ncbi:hypothetical protein F4861DRAFT_512926 [Xylaria intraflava]|nr:hypothetical protein F4861DRAFT_512926 [Xylaria intraflava]
MTDDNLKRNVLPQIQGLIPPLQRRHSDSQSKAYGLGPLSEPASPSSDETCRGRPESLTPLLDHTGNPLADPSTFSNPRLIKDDAQESSSRNKAEVSSVAAHWVATQADFVGNPDEAASSPKSHPTRSSQSPANSTASIATTPGSNLPALQSTTLADHDGLKPLGGEDIDPASFDLVAPREAPRCQYSIESQSEFLFSTEHLKVIFEDSKHTQKFTDFLYTSRPDAVPLFNYYLSLVKALKAIVYANAVVREIADVNRSLFDELPLTETISKSLKSRADETLRKLAEEELPAYVTHVWTQIVSITIKQRITNTLAPDLHELSEGLAEVFCLTDPAQDDNPIVFASEEFHKTTQYGRGLSLGRNCRFLQGPDTNKHSVKRLREVLATGKEHCEPILNYRRDGSAFMNLLMIAPLYDNRGNIRYYLGVQVDVSGLLKECGGLTSLAELVARKQGQSKASIDDVRKSTREQSCSSKDALSELAEKFSLSELRIVQASGETVQDTSSEEPNSAGGGSSTDNNNGSQSLAKGEAVAIAEAPMDNSISSSAFTSLSGSSLTGRFRGILDHYLLVRPFPSMQILFASPSLRVPGILHSSFLSRIGGSQTTRDVISKAFKDGHGVKTKVRWLARRMAPGLDTSISLNPNHGRNRWVHATPLFGADGTVGVWVVILIDEDEKRRVLEAPPVELFNLERRQPFDIGIDDPIQENSNGKPCQNAGNGEQLAEGSSLPSENVAATAESAEPGASGAPRPLKLEGQSWI